MLRERKERTVNHLMGYVLKYQHILQTHDASEMLTLSTRNKHHAMRALACLSKYQGCYNEWKEIKESYGFKWTVTDDLSIFHSMMDSKNNYSAMLDWLKNICSKIPESYGNILLFNTLTGLRPEEACASVALIKKDLDDYLKKEGNSDKNGIMFLEHYRYPDIFIRRTKKAYISIISKDVLELASNSGDHNYNAIFMLLKRKRYPIRIKYCLKIFATYLRMKGVESEFIDLLQGRIPKSVFARHYFRPDFNEQCKNTRRLL